MKKQYLLVNILIITINVLCFSQSLEFNQEHVDRVLLFRTLDLDPKMLIQIIESGDIRFLEYVFNPIQLGILDFSHLRLLRNMIFASHGYIFQSYDLVSFFSTFPWYTPTLRDVTNLLTNADQLNISHILGIEEIEPIQAVSTTELVGVWQNMPVMASGWSERFIFFENGDVFYGLSTMNTLPSVQYFYGKYRIDNGFLQITVTDKKVVHHSSEIELTAGFGYQWVKVDTKYEPLEEPLSIMLPIKWMKTVELDSFGQRIELNIAGFLFYYMSKDPMNGIYG